MIEIDFIRSIENFLQSQRPEDSIFSIYTQLLPSIKFPCVLLELNKVTPHACDGRMLVQFSVKVVDHLPQKREVFSLSEWVRKTLEGKHIELPNEYIGILRLKEKYMENALKGEKPYSITQEFEGLIRRKQ